MLQPVTTADPSPLSDLAAPRRAEPGSPAAEGVEAVFEDDPLRLHAAIRAGSQGAGLEPLLDAAVGAWLDRRGVGGTTGANALLTLFAARDLGRHDPMLALPAAVASLGFLRFAAGTRPASSSLPLADSLHTWADWGQDALLFAALERWRGNVYAGSPELAAQACRQVAAKPNLRSLRGLLLATHVAGAHAAAAARVAAFLDDPRSGPPLAAAPPPDPAPRELVWEAVERAARLDPRPTLGHAMQAAAAWSRLRALDDLPPGWADAALLTTAGTWPRLERSWRTFLSASPG